MRLIATILLLAATCAHADIVATGVSMTGVSAGTPPVGGCAGAPDFTDSLVFLNFNSDDPVACSVGVGEIAYTTHATQEFPASQAFTFTAGAGTDVGISSSDAMTPDSDCVLSLDANASADNLEHFNFTRDWSGMNTTGSMAIRFESTETPSFTRQFIQIGDGADNRLTFAVTTGGNVGCDLIGNDVVNRPMTTANDTNTCCAGGTATCAGNMLDGVEKTVECVWDNDFQEMWVDGCLVDNGTGTWAGVDVFDFTASAEKVQMGMTTDSAISFDVHVGLFAVSSTKNKNYHSLWSGGDGDMTNGNECWNHDD